MKYISHMALGLVLIVSISAHAGNIKQMLSLYSQKLELNYSSNFQIGSQSSKNGVYLMELVPRTESVQVWTELLAISAYENMASTQTAESAMKLETDSVKAACPKDFVLEKISSRDSQGYPSSLVIFGCSKHPTLTGKSELALQLVIQGKKDIYLVKKAFHKDIGAKDTLSKKNYTTLAPEVLNVKICKGDNLSTGCLPDPK